MKHSINITIDCGKTTCASVKGKFCHLLRTSLNGKDNCFLFGRVFDKNGWIQRHSDCLKIAKVIK